MYLVKWNYSDWLMQGIPTCANQLKTQIKKECRRQSSRDMGLWFYIIRWNFCNRLIANQKGFQALFLCAPAMRTMPSVQNCTTTFWWWQPWKGRTACHLRASPELHVVVLPRCRAIDMNTLRDRSLKTLWYVELNYVMLWNWTFGVAIEH